MDREGLNDDYNGGDNDRVNDEDNDGEDNGEGDEGVIRIEY